jgi:hypothetical protein
MRSAEDLRAQVHEAWQAFRAELDGADPDATTSAGWTVKEMLAHVAFWMETVPPFVTGAFRGDESAFETTFPSGYEPGDDDWPSADVHNAREAAWAREQPYELVLTRAEQAHVRLTQFLATVTDEEAEIHAGYFADVGGHLDAHRLEELAPDA